RRVLLRLAGGFGLTLVERFPRLVSRRRGLLQRLRRHRRVARGQLARLLGGLRGLLLRFGVGLACGVGFGGFCGLGLRQLLRFVERLAGRVAGGLGLGRFAVESLLRCFGRGVLRLLQGVGHFVGLAFLRGVLGLRALRRVGREVLRRVGHFLLA